MLEEYAHNIIVGTNGANFRNHKLRVLLTCKQRDLQCSVAGFSLEHPKLLFLSDYRFGGSFMTALRYQEYLLNSQG